MQSRMCALASVLLIRKQETAKGRSLKATTRQRAFSTHHSFLLLRPVFRYPCGTDERVRHQPPREFLQSRHKSGVLRRLTRHREWFIRRATGSLVTACHPQAMGISAPPSHPNATLCMQHHSHFKQTAPSQPAHQPPSCPHPSSSPDPASSPSSPAYPQTSYYTAQPSPSLDPSVSDSD